MALPGHRVNGGCDDHHLDVWRSKHYNTQQHYGFTLDMPRITFVELVRFACFWFFFFFMNEMPCEVSEE